MMEGMKQQDLRDFFAALALAGMLAKPDIHPPSSVTTRAESATTLPTTDDVLAERAYRLADALLKARRTHPAEQERT